MGEIILQWKTLKLLPKGDWLAVSLQLEQHVFCVTVTDSRSLALKVAEVHNFPRTLNTADTAERKWCMVLRDDTQN